MSGCNPSSFASTFSFSLALPELAEQARNGVPTGVQKICTRDDSGGELYGSSCKGEICAMSAVVISPETTIETSLTGQLLLDNPLLNKGSAFPKVSDGSSAFGTASTALFHN